MNWSRFQLVLIIYKQVDKLDFDKVKTVPVDLKKISDVVDKDVEKKTLYNTLSTKLKNLEKQIPGASALIQTNQCNTNKKNLEKKIGDVENNILDISGLVSTAVFNTKINELENKIPDVTGLASTPLVYTKTDDVENIVPNVSGLFHYFRL